MFLHSAADHSGEKVDQWFVRSGVVDAGEVNALLDGRASVSEGVLRDAGWSPVQVPGAVENSEAVDKSDFTFTYLKLIRFESMPDSDLLLSLGQISDKDRTYFNGELIGSMGDWGVSEPQVYDKPRFYSINRESIRSEGLNVLLVQVQRYFEDASGILQGSVYMGLPQEVMGRFYLIEFMQIWMIPCYWMIGISFLFMSFQRSWQKDYLAFGVFCITLSFYILLRSPLRYAVEFDFLFWKRIEYALCYPLGSCFFWFFENFLAHDGMQLSYRNRVLVRFGHFVTGVIMLVVFVTHSPLTWFWMFSSVLMYVWMGFSVLGFALLYRKLKEGDLHVILLLIGLLLFLVVVVIDVLRVKDVLSFPIMLIGYGCFGLMISIAFVLVHRFFDVYRRVEHLNANLEAEVLAQTAELRQAMKDSQVANEVKSQFLANVSHELRTPMNGIVGMKHLLSHTQLNAQQKDYLETLNTCANTLRELIDEILDFSSLERIGEKERFEDFHLHALIQQIATPFKEKLGSAGIGFEIFIQADVPSVLHGDVRKLGHVLQHLLRNSVKFTHHGRVDFKARCINQAKAHDRGVRDDSDYYLELVIEDTGIGIPAEMQEKIFLPFTQVDASMTRQYGGLGVGLTIAKRLIEQMNGQIGVESAEGKGSQFWIVVPIEKARSAAPKESSAIKAPVVSGVDDHPNARYRLLVVEDNEVNLQFMVLILQKAGYDIVVARNGRQAVDIVEDDSVDLVLMDLQMPIMDGYEAARMIRFREKELESREPVPIFAITAQASVEDRRRSMDAGMSAYFVKPINPEILLSAVSSVLSHG
jgi:signal transduction histidine kinase/CheY-like chemotaxis protein